MDMQIAKTFQCETLALVAWRSGNEFHPINEVTLCQAGLVLGWVTCLRAGKPFGM